MTQELQDAVDRALVELYLEMMREPQKSWLYAAVEYLRFLSPAGAACAREKYGSTEREFRAVFQKYLKATEREV
jgi:hypothetical protein